MKRRASHAGHGEDARRRGQVASATLVAHVYSRSRQYLRRTTSQPCTTSSPRSAHAGCQVAIVHARKAVLGGLSPKDNREVPPLRYDIVKRIKQAFPHLPVIVNGGFRDSEDALGSA